MALIVGNLLTDPAAQSFISLADANDYLTPEGIPDWDSATDAQKEASLVRASRWMAVTLPWCSPNLTAGQLVTVGLAAARLASDTIGVFLMTADQPGQEVKREKVGPIEVEYRDLAGASSRIDGAGGRYWPWLLNMLDGIVCQSPARIGVLVV